MYSWVSGPFAVTSALYKTDLKRHSPFRGQLTVPLLHLQLDGDVDVDVGTRMMMMLDFKGDVFITY